VGERVTAGLLGVVGLGDVLPPPPHPAKIIKLEIAKRTRTKVTLDSHRRKTAGPLPIVAIADS
jgi:hypothetical protein